MACFHKSKILAILYSVVCLNEVLCSNEVKAVSEGSVKYEGTINIKMPGTRPLKKDTYLCTALQLPPLKQYIVRLEPNATQQTAHHMLLYGCRSPGAQLSSWNCQRGPCNGEQNILYAWAKDAPSRNLPKDVGIGVGGDSGIKYLVLQVHYASATPFKGGAKDFSGFTLHTSQHQLPYEAGIYLLWAGRGSIPPETSGMHVDVGCTYNEPEPMFAFAFRTHAHKLAKVITGYRIRNGVWTLLGKGNPQAPQAFCPMESTIEIKEGDMLAARCTYDSKGHDIQRVIHMGPSGDDEMCNFYIMYYSSAGRLKYSGGDCGQQNHPNVFKNFPPDSDTPLTGSKDLKDRESSVPMISTSAERNTTNPEQTPEKETALVPVSLKVSTDSPTHGKSQGFDISDLGSAKEESPSAKAEAQVGTKPPQELPAFEKSQSLIPVTTSTPVLPVTQSTDEKELRVVLDWPSFTAMETSKLGEVTGVSLDSTGQVVVFHRGSRTWNENTFDSSHVFQNADIEGTIKEHTVWIIDSLTGKIRGFWGKDMFFLPHGLTVDHEDNLWLTDVGSHQVFKFSPLGRSTKLMLSLGDKLVPGSDRSRFCQPTSVAVDRNGEFFVADGYCNSRILKFSADGKLLSSWGERSLSGPGLPALGSLSIPHSLSLDQSSHTLYVADRENGRVQSISSISGTFVDEIILPEFGGKVFAVDYSVSKQGGVLHVVSGRSQIKGVQNVPVQGFTIRVADKVILQTWPSDEEQALVYPHDVASSVDGSDVYVVEISPSRILKLSSKRQVDSFSNKTSTTPLNIEPAKTGDRVVSQGSHSIPGKSIDEFNPQQGESENTSPKGKSTHRASADPDQLKKYGKDPSLPSVSSTGTIGLSSPNPTETVTVKNNSASGPQDDTSSSDSNVDITAGIIPALIILSVLAVPIVFLLLISITLRVRAYRRDKRNQMSDFHGGRKDFSVGRTRGWWSYMNCFDRQKYKFNRVTLQDFYSDSDSDGV